MVSRLILCVARSSFCLTLTAVAGLLSSPTSAQNLLANPGFESGNSGFSSDYSYSSGGNCCEGQYTVSSTPSTFNGAFINPSPASAGSVLMMVVNGATTPNQRVWYVNVAVASGATYRLEMSGCTAVTGGPAILQWQIGGTLIGNSLPLPNGRGVWVSGTNHWTATTGGTVQVAIRNLNISRFPNDFYIDDLSMVACTNQASRSSYGNGWPGQQGIPSLIASADPVSGTTITLNGSSSSGLASSPGALTLGISKTAIPLLGGTLLTSLDIVLNVQVPSSGMVLPLPIPPAPNFCGSPLHFQLLQLDVAASHGVSFTPGLTLTVGH